MMAQHRRHFKRSYLSYSHRAMTQAVLPQFRARRAGTVDVYEGLERTASGTAQAWRDTYKCLPGGLAMSSWFNPKTEKRVSPIQGRGLFARAAIPAGEIVAVKGG